MKKKLVIAASLIFALTSLLIGGAFASGRITIVVNGQTVPTDVSPRNVDGRVMVPISTISKALGANVTWDSKNQTVIINQKNGTSGSSPDIWNEKLNLVGGEWAEIVSLINKYFVTYDSRDEEAWKNTIAPSYLDNGSVALPGGGVYPSILELKIIDAKNTGKVEAGDQYKIRVKIVHYMNLSTPFVAEWDLDITPYMSKGYLIDEAQIISDTQLSNYTVFPGLTFQDVSE
jgi:hypothetical protein